MKVFYFFILMLFLNKACAYSENYYVVKPHNLPFTVETDKIYKTQSEWKKILSSSEYYVTRQDGTERAFTGILDKNYQPGIYHCSNCNQPLFSSLSKYDSKSGWPSFWAPIDKTVMLFEEDNSFFYKRTEVSCSRCGAHLGHVFEDGPEPTGLRYCINSKSLIFIHDNGTKIEG